MVDKQNWLDRWNQNRIGFHESAVNRYLRQYLPEFGLASGACVFLPLCGKALDIAWIAQQGYEVIGVELSQLAIEAFFEEQQLDFERFDSDRFGVYQSGRIRLLQGDFFDLSATDLITCRLVYDRAALIAMEHRDRRSYCDHMLSILPAASDMLLISFDYDQAQMQGPPFSVPADEVYRYYSKAFSINLLETNDIIDERPRWRDVGLTALRESVFRCDRRET